MLTKVTAVILIISFLLTASTADPTISPAEEIRTEGEEGMERVGGSPDDDNAAGSQSGTPAEEDVFEVDLVSLTDTQQDASPVRDTFDPDVSDLNMSINTKMTEDGNLVIEPVFGSMRNVDKAKKEGGLLGDNQLVLTESTIVQGQGNKKIKRTRRVYRLPPGQKVQLGTFVKKTPDGRKMRITRKQHVPKPQERIH